MIASGTVIISGLIASDILAINSFLKSNDLRRRPVCMLETDVRISWALATAIAAEYSILPRAEAIGARNITIPTNNTRERRRFDQKATFAFFCCSLVFLKSCCTRYLPKPASVIISIKLTNMLQIANTPKSFGVSILARTILVIGVTSFVATSEKSDHFTDLCTPPLSLVIYIVAYLIMFINYKT